MTTLTESLTAITQVQNWESINFSILPGEDPKGYLFPLAINSQGPSRQVTTYGVAIALSSDSIQGLAQTSIAIAKNLSRTFSGQPVCSDQGVVRLTSPIDIEPPQSYPQQSNVTLTTGFFTAVSFTVEVG